MKVLIVEDETAAYENLVAILAVIAPHMEIAGNTESVYQTIEWLRSHPLPDLILMDIHLSDGTAFTVFERMKIEAPIIFTTAYDEYAIEAFKVNSLDYLLKPIKTDELERALEKFSKWTRTDITQYLAHLSQLNLVPRYKDKMLISMKDRLFPIDIKDVACFYTADKNTWVYMKDGKRYSYSKTLEQIISTLNPVHFIRANKQFIIARDSINHITIWFDNRLLVSLQIETPERIYISKNKAVEFKAWIVNEQ